MMVEAPPSPPFEVIQSDLFLEFEVIALDPPAQFGEVDHPLERDVGWQRGQPVVLRLGGTFRPLDQQPLFRGEVAAGQVRRRANALAGKPRGEHPIAAFPPGDGLPGLGRQLPGEHFSTVTGSGRFSADLRRRRVASARRAGASPGRQIRMLENTPTT